VAVNAGERYDEVVDILHHHGGKVLDRSPADLAGHAST